MELRLRNSSDGRLLILLHADNSRHPLSLRLPSRDFAVLPRRDTVRVWRSSTYRSGSAGDGWSARCRKWTRLSSTPCSTRLQPAAGTRTSCGNWRGCGQMRAGPRPAKPRLSASRRFAGTSRASPCGSSKARATGTAYTSRALSWPTFRRAASAPHLRTPGNSVFARLSSRLAAAASSRSSACRPASSSCSAAFAATAGGASRGRNCMRSRAASSRW
jgi:hypothetical protein